MRTVVLTVTVIITGYYLTTDVYGNKKVTILIQTVTKQAM